MLPWRMTHRARQNVIWAAARALRGAVSAVTMLLAVSGGGGIWPDAEGRPAADRCSAKVQGFA